MYGDKRPLLGVTVSAAVVVVVVVGLTLTTGVDWFYPRPITTVAIMVVVVLATLIAWRLLPCAWRPTGILPVVVAAVAGYVFLRIAVSAGWTEFTDHQVLEPLEGEVDDFPTWLFAAFGGTGVLVVTVLVSRWAARSSGDHVPRVRAVPERRPGTSPPDRVGP
ncbi:hypothetical protein SAMN05660657_00187 [Geodermatophilus amargosae]|uniref:Uncharacterized protein n=1 Tax=Geodermatophilus amargosae TaxID=1296565 RepID=A0A1I6X6H6_9ACTN|nr:hypothetical protein SAMN05660657_00187 [Geodermatophilus amargosae]